VKQIMNYLNSY